MINIILKNENGQEIWDLTTNGHEFIFWDSVPEAAVPILEGFGLIHKKDFIVIERKMKGEYTPEEIYPFLCG